MLRSDTISSQRSYGFWQKLGILVDTIIRVKNWHIPILFYLGMGKKEDIVLFRDGTKCILRDKSDATGFYENFFLKTNVGEDVIIKENDIIIDVGAHVGFFSIYAAKKASKGMVYAFEPSQESFRNLQRNIKLNNLDNVIAVEVETRIRSRYLGHSKLNDVYQLMVEHGLKLYDLKPWRITLNDYKHKNLIERIMGVKNDSSGFGHPINEFDMLFFRCPDDIINSKDQIMLRKLVLCLCLYGFYPSALEITERAREENILTDSEAEIINNSIRTIYEKNNKKILDRYPLFKRIIYRILNKLIGIYDKRAGWNKMPLFGDN